MSAPMTEPVAAEPITEGHFWRNVSATIALLAMLTVCARSMFDGYIFNKNLTDSRSTVDPNPTCIVKMVKP